MLLPAIKNNKRHQWLGLQTSHSFCILKEFATDGFLQCNGFGPCLHGCAAHTHALKYKSAEEKYAGANSAQLWDSLSVGHQSRTLLNIFCSYVLCYYWVLLLKCFIMSNKSNNAVNNRAYLFNRSKGVNVYFFKFLTKRHDVKAKNRK